MTRPSIFVGSSSEALDLAHTLSIGLEQFADVTVWNEGIFQLGSTTIESLLRALDIFDFAVLLVTPDDITVSRGRRRATPRDNVLFELGLFVGRLGRFRTFVVVPSGSGQKIPSDLAGVTFAHYQSNRGTDPAATREACMQIRKAVESQPRRSRLSEIADHVRMSTWSEIYNRAMGLVERAESRVRSTSFTRGNWLGNPEYISRLSKIASRQKSKRGEFLHKVVYSESKGYDDGRSQSIEERINSFRSEGVAECLSVREHSGFWGLDLLIVDDTHMHLSFHGIRDEALVLGIEFADVPELVRPMAQWYDEYLFDGGKPISA